MREWSLYLLSYIITVRDPLREGDPQKAENGWYTVEYEMVYPHNSGGLTCHNWRINGLNDQTVPADLHIYGPGFWAGYYETR